MLEDRLKKVVLKTNQENIEIVFVSCLHIGQKEMQYDLWEKYKDYILKNDNVYLVTMGDLGDFSIPAHMGFTMWNQDESPSDQIDIIVRELTPIAQAGKLIGMYDGNHEMRIWRPSSISPTKIIADRLGVSYNGIGGYLWIEVSDKDDLCYEDYVFFLLHKSRGQTTQYAIKKIMLNGWGHSADIVGVAHLHTFDEVNMYYNEITSNGIERVKRSGFATASFLSTPEYALQDQYDVQKAGATIVKLFVDKKHWIIDNSGEDKFES